jgi:hypothetical protein
MRVSRIVLGLVVAALALAPAVGFAASDLSASPVGKHHGARVHHQPDRAWRTVPGTPPRAAAAPVLTRVERASATEPGVTLPPVVRVPFVPPRG